MTLTFKVCLLTLFAGFLAFAGCTNDVPPAVPSTASSASAIDGSQFLLMEEPDDAADVVKVREESSDGDDVVLVGRIGGSVDPWVKGRAAFSIVDGSLKACSDIPGDECPKPWDYCCETDKLANSMALVKLVDREGTLVKADARQLLGVTELSTVVVKGTAQRDDTGNLTVLATSVFVKQK